MHKLFSRVYALGIVSGVVLYAFLVCLVLASPVVYIGVKALQHVNAHGVNVKHTHGKP